MEELGIALGLDKESATADEIHHQLWRVLNERQFQQSVQQLSQLMRDVKEPPLERAIDLIHYLIRHKGAPHLKLASRSLNFVQYFSIDALIFLAFIFLCLCYLQFIMLKKFISVISVVFSGLVAKTVGRWFRVSSYLGLLDFSRKNNTSRRGNDYNNNNLSSFSNSSRNDTQPSTSLNTNVKTLSNSSIHAEGPDSNSNRVSVPGYNLRHLSNGSFTQDVKQTSTSLHHKKRD